MAFTVSSQLYETKGIPQSGCDLRARSVHEIWSRSFPISTMGGELDSMMSIFCLTWIFCSSKKHLSFSLGN